MDIEMREIFNESQRVDRHHSLVKRLVKLQNKQKSQSFVKRFYAELLRNIKLTLMSDSRSPFTNHAMDFVIQYLLKFVPSNGENKCPQNESDMTLIDTVLNDVVIPLMHNSVVETRVNACELVRKLFDELKDFNSNNYISVRRAVLERCSDRNTCVRSAAVLALHRFQEINSDGEDSDYDIPIKAIQFHLNNDPDTDVRLNCLKTIAKSSSTLSDFISATRDIKEVIRKTAFIQIAEKIEIKEFTIEQRLTILKNGLKDRSPVVRKAVETVLIPAWVKSYDIDKLVDCMVKLLTALDIQTDIDLIEKMLDIYFKQLNRENVCETSCVTKFQVLVKEFSDNYLNEERVFKVSLNCEVVFLWRYLCEFTTNLAQNESLQTTDETTEQTNDDERVEGENSSDPDIKRDLIDFLLPDVPYYCLYLEKFINTVISQELDIEDVMDFEFIYLQIMKISLLFDIKDKAQRDKLVETMKFILINNRIGNSFENYISPVMKCLAKNGFPDNTSFLTFTNDIIVEIYDSITCSSDENDSNYGEMKEMEEKIEKLTIEMNKEKVKLEEKISNENFDEAEDLKQIINKLGEEINALKSKMSSNSSQSSQKSLPPFNDFPKHLERCLHIFSGCLQFGDFNEVKTLMQNLIDKVVLPGFLCEEKLRIISIQCLGLVCFISEQYFKKYLHLLIQVFLEDIESNKLFALKSIFDSLCEHGINIFEGQDIHDRNEKSHSLTDCVVFEDNDEDFITSMKLFFETQLDLGSDEIKFVTVQGISKLLLLGKMYSSQLLSKLIILCFNPNEKRALIQFIGDFLRFYAFAESQGVIVGQSCLEEAFIITMKTVDENSYDFVISENLIKFFLNNINEESHPRLVITLIKELIICDFYQSNRNLVEKYFLPALSQLNFNELELKDLESIESEFEAIETKSKECKSKQIHKNIAIIKDKIVNCRLQIKPVVTFDDDFAPIDDNEEQNHSSQVQYTALKRKQDSHQNIGSEETKRARNQIESTETIELSETLNQTQNQNISEDENSIRNETIDDNEEQNHSSQVQYTAFKRKQDSLQNIGSEETKRARNQIETTETIELSETLNQTQNQNISEDENSIRNEIIDEMDEQLFESNQTESRSVNIEKQMSETENEKNDNKSQINETQLMTNENESNQVLDI